MVSESKIKAFLEDITEIQDRLLCFRKQLRTKDLDEWNAKAHLVFSHTHLEAVRTNLERSLNARSRQNRAETEKPSSK